MQNHQLLRAEALDDPCVRFLAVQRWVRRMPPAHQALNDARLRIERALEHKAEIETEVATWLKTAQSGVEVQAHGGGQQVRLLNHGAARPPRGWSVVVGEAVHNLRAALDYLVYALAWMATGEHVERTQFPICDEPEWFKSERGRRLGALTSSQATAIEDLQPYDSRPPLAWLRTLRDLSNQDKHWALNLTIPQGSAHSTFNYEVKDQSGNPTVEHEETVELFFDGERPVVKTLDALCVGVKQTLDQLSPLFQPRVITELNDWVLIATMPGPFSVVEMMQPNPFVPSKWLEGSDA